MLPEVGSFGTDTAERVLGAKLCANSIIVTIEWHTRQDGKKPKPSQFSNSTVRENCPELLVDFYESRINLKTKPVTQTPAPATS